MRFPLTVLSLFLLALLVVWQISLLFSGSMFARGKSRRFGPRAAPGNNEIANSLANVCKDALYLYVPFAAVALMMLSFGKPGLLPQYAGWSVVVLQILRSASVAMERPRLRSVFGVLAMICLIYLWVLQLPLFDPFPA